MTDPIRVVLIGGGYASLQAYHAIVRRMRRRVLAGELRITLISPAHCHQFHGWSAEVLQGIIAPEHHLTSLRELMPLADLVLGQVVSVDADARAVSVRLNLSLGLQTIGYDHLLLGAGSSDDLEAVPGLEEHGFRLKRPDGIVSLRDHLVSVVELAGAITDPARRAELLSFVFVGGGYMGVELCAAVAELLGKWGTRHPVLKAHPPKIQLVYAGGRVLAGIGPRLLRIARYAEQQLLRYGVELIGDTRVQQVREHLAVLSNGRELHARTIVVALGQRPMVLPGTEHLPRANDGRLIVERTLQVGSVPRLWAGGDAAHVEHPRAQGACPATAFWAIRHGTHIGGNIVRAIEGRPLRAFDVFPLGESASFGIGKGVAELNGVVVVGWLAWINRLLFFLCFMPSWRQAARVLLDWLSFMLLGARGSNVEMARAEPSAHGDRPTGVLAVSAAAIKPLETANGTALSSAAPATYSP